MSSRYDLCDCIEIRFKYFFLEGKNYYQFVSAFTINKIYIRDIHVTEINKILYTVYLFVSRC